VLFLTDQGEQSVSPSQAEPTRVGVTQLLRAWSEGDEAALERLAPLVENELHRLAHKYMRREGPGKTLQTTALVNEVYLRLIDIQEVSWQNRAHFFAVSAKMMRRILTDFARSQQYLKRGGGVVQVSWDEALEVSQQPDADIVALDDALNELALLDPRKAQVVELRFFGGLSIEEIAEVLKVAQRTVMRDWKFAKAWLLRALSRQDSHE
jgi:RNA polymerase sigma factor (TIGR02999 family)